MNLDFDAVSTPCFIVDEAALEKNLAVLGGVQEQSGCKILLALKGFAMFHVFPLLRKTLKGVCASSPHEARLGRELFGGEVHTYAPAYSESDMASLVAHSDHIIFNSFAQWHRYKPVIAACGRPIRCGIRINPGHSEVAVKIYDPCAPESRLGVRRADFEPDGLEGISGLHFHALCESNIDALVRTFQAMEERFGEFLPRLEWINLGGGHHITRSDYHVRGLVDFVKMIRNKYSLTVYLEPGEAVALNAGVLVTTVLDIVSCDVNTAILDTSAAAHMPDVLEMPYRPEILGAGFPHEKPHTYRLGGLTCLAGDVIGTYSFDRPLAVGDKLVFLDMAHYSMVKTTTFNGIQLPHIFLYQHRTHELIPVRRFGYEDYKNRLS